MSLIFDQSSASLPQNDAPTLPPQSWLEIPETNLALVEVVLAGDSQQNHEFATVAESAAFRAIVEQSQCGQGLFRVVNINREKRSVDLASASTLKIIHTDVDNVKLPPIVYVGQLVNYDRENQCLTSGAAPHAPSSSAVRTHKQWTGLIRIIVHVARQPQFDAAALITIRKRWKAHHLVILTPDNTIQASNINSKYISVAQHAPVHLKVIADEQVTNLPIMFSSMPPSNSYKPNGLSLTSGANPSTVPAIGAAILEDVLCQATLLPGAYMTASNCSVPPSCLKQFGLDPQDLWIVTPTPVSGDPASVYEVKSHYKWIAVDSWAVLDIGSEGPFFRNRANVLVV